MTAVQANTKMYEQKRKPHGFNLGCVRLLLVR